MNPVVILLDRSWMLTNQTSYCFDGINTAITSENYRGVLRPVTTVIGGGIMRYWGIGEDPTPEKLKECYALLGCFVGIEAKPRFLITVNLYKELRTYLLKSNPLNDLSIKKGKIPDSVFEEGSIELSIRLWKV